MKVWQQVRKSFFKKQLSSTASAPPTPSSSSLFDFPPLFSLSETREKAYQRLRGRRAAIRGTITALSASTITSGPELCQRCLSTEGLHVRLSAEGTKVSVARPLPNRHNNRLRGFLAWI